MGANRGGSYVRSVRFLVLGLSILLTPHLLWAQQGVLETPQQGSFQSGVGLVRGWVCSANRVDVEIVGLGSVQAVYGELRGDTQSVCGDSNNGFSLQINWNELGEGTHTVRALVDGVELGRAQVVVATLGQKYLQGAQGEFTVSPFPQEGKQTRIRWQESRQAFVITNGGTPASGGGNPRADARLEDPSPGTFQGGIGLVRGWVCSANRVDVELDGRITVQAVYGESRGDTRGVCNDDNNGFSLQVNWNDIGDGNHTIRVLADGAEVGSATFTVVSLGLGPFPTGLKGDFLVNDFPRIGIQTEVRWQESQQNFVITGARFPGIADAQCLPRTGQALDGTGGRAQVTLANPCLLSGNMAVLNFQVLQSAAITQEEQGREARAADGGAFRVCATNLTIEQGGKTFGTESFRLVDFTGQDVCVDVSPGGTLDALLQALAQSDLNFNAPFTLRYTNQIVIEIQPPLLGLAVSLEEIVFSSIAVGSSEDKTFTVTNIGPVPLVGGMTLIASDSGGNAFSLVSGDLINLGTGQSQAVTVRYSPVSTEPVSGNVRITTNGGVKSVLLRSGEVLPKLSVSPTSLDFGSVQPQSSVDRTFTVTNTGQGNLTGSVTTALPFSIVSGGSFSLPANQSQTVTVRFSPTAPGAATGSASVSSNDGAATVNLSGTGGPTDQLAPGVVVSGAISPLGEIDKYNFTLTSSGHVILQVDSPGFAIDPCLEVFTAQGTAVAGGAGYSGGRSTRLDLTLTAGTYLVLVSDQSNNDTGGYNLLLISP